MSVQSLNGDSYQGAQVGANVQSQVGTQPMCRQVNERIGAQEPPSYWLFPLLPRKTERERERGKCRNKTVPSAKPICSKDTHCRGESRPHFVNAFGSGLSVMLGRRERSREQRVR